MENNTPPQTEPVVAVPPAESPRQKSRFWLLFLGLFIIGLFFLGGTYFFISSQKTQQPTSITNQTIEAQKDIKQLDTDLDALDMKDIDDDFTEVDQELKNL